MAGKAVLYTYFRSSAAYRVRIALAVKGMALPGGQVEGVADPVQGGGGAGLQVQFDAWLRAQHGQVGLLRDVAESDAADLHG